MHFCQDEALAIGSTVPVIGIFFKKIHKWYHKASHHKCHQPGCEAEHLEHGHVEEVLMLNPTDRSVISVEEVDNLFGQLATIFLMHDRKLLETQEFPPHSEFVFFIRQELNGIMLDLSARWKNKFFLWDGEKWERELAEKLEEEVLIEDISLDKAAEIILMFMTNEKIYNSMLDWDKSEAFLEAEKFLETISLK
jgi:hypothetical protein